MIRGILIAMMNIALFTAFAPQRADHHQTKQSVRFADVKLKTGVRLNYAEQGSPTGQPIIMLHGISDSWFSFSRILPAFDSNYHVYVLDQRGHGDSEKPPTGYKFSDFAGDVIAFMDAKGLKQATLVGHSMGSFVAQQVAVAAPRRVERLILIGSATTVRNEAVLGFQQTLQNFKDPIKKDFLMEFQRSTFTQPVPDDFVERAVGESQKLSANIWRAVVTGMLSGDAKDRLKEIQSPTLIIWGDRDSFFLRAEQDALKAALPKATLKIYSDTGHAPHWELPERVIQDIKSFMTKPE